MLDDFDACFFCLGVSSVGLKKEVYEKMTYELTIGFAKALVKGSPECNILLYFRSGNRFHRKGQTALGTGKRKNGK